MKLSIGMIVRNEEKWLEKCLVSLEPLRKAIASELIVVDTGSEDRTIEIARQFTKRVYSHKWNNDFAAMRNIVLGYARGEWFFSIDGDEVLENPEAIIRFLISPKSKKFRTAQVVIRNILRQTPIVLADTAVSPRIFRNEPGFYYVGSIHEQPLWRPPVIQLDATLVHYGYLNDDAQLMERKFQRNESMLKAALQSDPDNIYYWFQLYQTYAMHKNHEEALGAITRAYDLVKRSPLPRQKFMNVLIGKVRAHYALRQYRLAIEAAVEAKKASGDYPDIYYFKALAHLAIGEKEEAIGEFRSFLELAARFKNHNAFKDPSVAHHSIDKVDYVRQEFIRLCYDVGKYEDAIQRVWEFDKLDLLEPVAEQVISSFFEVGEYKELREFFRLLQSRADDKLREKFLIALEERRLRADPDVDRQLSLLFSDDDSEYALLNRVRLSQPSEELRSLLVSVKEFKWADVPVFYGELLYIALSERLVELDALTGVQENHLLGLLSFAQRRHSDVPVVLAQWLCEGTAPATIGELRVAKALAQYVLLHHEWDSERFKSLFDMYVTWGVEYIRRLYNPEVLNAELETEFKSSEEVALLHLWKGSLPTIGARQRLTHLRRALDTFPLLARGIRTWLEDLQAQLHNQEFEEHKAKAEEPIRLLVESGSMGEAETLFDNELQLPLESRREFERHKETVKDNIRTLVTAGRLEEAETLLQEYASLVPNDPEVYAIGSTIAAARNDWDGAIELAKRGLELKSDSFDLTFNLAYALCVRGALSEALKACKQAEVLARSPEEIGDVRALLNEIEAQLTNTPVEQHSTSSVSDRRSGAPVNRAQVIVASPVRQTPEVLNAFLESLLRLDLRGLNVQYVFVDDNEVPESKALLRKFAARVAERVTIWEASTSSERYVKDERTHYWTEELMWRVGRMKDELIDFAVGAKASHLLLVDSDLVLHPLTLKQLVVLGLPIVSEIFWTKWNPDGPELPQVWLGGQYRLYRRSPGESVSNADVGHRTRNFLASLRRPGVYQVGGLGALTLFSREALLRGVRFAPIPNLDLVGEDRHLCVRAAALGIPLHVDTHYPALHLYRRADLERVESYMRKTQTEAKIIQTIEGAVEALFTSGPEADSRRKTFAFEVRPTGVMERIREELVTGAAEGISSQRFVVHNGSVRLIGQSACKTDFRLRIVPVEQGPAYDFRGTARLTVDAVDNWRVMELRLEESEPIQPTVLV